jgi:hypothetical protein
VDFEKLGAFYLGRRYDIDAAAISPDLVLYDSRDLVTHALIVGMTGSGKTGLGVTLIEEAAIDGVPAIVIDPKGDLTNLLLTFPDLRPADFEPWVTEDEAARAGQSRAAFAAAQAGRWAKGLAEWGQDGARIQRLRDAAQFTVFTPGSTAGTPVSVLASFAPPPANADPEAFAERVQATVSSLLTLIGIEADPLKSRECILLSTILAEAWKGGRSPDLPALVHGLQQPPFTHVGVMDVESFFPQKDRFAFALAVNALLAAPGFEAWTRGEPLDVAALLRSTTGRPRVSIFSLAHLDDTHRMFFVTLLLNAVTAWMRSQSGTGSLRALVYMDEIFGFFPPVANPPSKPPLLTLLKQGRAAGLGVVLATQNPVDLDYKGLSNIGTWCIGRLQTERDKARVIDGLEAASAGARVDRSDVDRLLSRLSSRVFLLRNVHDEGLTLFHTRWALSYLRGPLDRDAIRALTAQSTEARHLEAPSVRESARRGTDAPREVTTADVTGTATGVRPMVGPGVPQFFAPAGQGADVWTPYLYAAATVRFVDRKLKLDAEQLVTRLTAVVDRPVPVDWNESFTTDLDPDELSATTPEGRFQTLPPAAAKSASYAAWTRQWTAWVGSNVSVEVLQSPSTGLVSQPGESERDFRARLQQSARETRDQGVGALRKKYAPRRDALEAKLMRARQAVSRETEQASSEKMHTAISFGATVFAAILGRGRSGTVGRATTMARGANRAVRAARDVERARETVAALEEDQRALEEAFRQDVVRIETITDAATETLERVIVRPRRNDIHTKVVGLVWYPGDAERVTAVR